MTSQATQFSIDEKKNQVIPALTSINGLGESVALQIIKARNEHPFTSVNDLMERAHVGQTMIEKLRSVNALDGLPDDDQMTLFDML